MLGSGAQTKNVSAFGGFVSATGKVPPRKSTIDYFTPINQPFTDCATAKELLRQSEEATKEVGQAYVLNTFDLGGCMKVLPMIWVDPKQYEKHIVLAGAFHTGMNYINQLTGHKMKGSGYAEILIEAGLVTSGTLQGVLSGKKYAKALFSLKTMTEAFERLLFETFVEEKNIDMDNPEALINLVENCTRENLDSTLKDESVMKLLEQYAEYEKCIRD